WRQPESVIAAGLLHSVYSTEAYRHTLISISDRAKVAAVAGEEGERLAYLFCTIRRNHLFKVLAQMETADWESVVIGRNRSAEYQEISRREVGALLVLHMANQAEQSEPKDCWLSQVSQWGAWAHPLVQQVPPVFHGCSEQVTADKEKFGLECYGAGVREFKNFPDSKMQNILASAKTLPWVAEPLVFLAYEALLGGRWLDAFAFATSALALFDEWGTAWDKRLAFADWKSASAYIKHWSEHGFTEPTTTTRLVRESVAAGAESWIQTFRRLAGELCQARS